MRLPHFKKVFAFTLLLILTFQSLLAQIPAIRSLVPNFGTVGTSVIIKGVNFNTNATNNIVYFGAVKATITAATDTTLIVTVPTGATLQPVTVTTNYLTAYSPQAFSIFSPGSTTLLPSNFSTPATFSTGNGVGNSIACDVDGDGKADLITANTYDHSFSVLRNNSTIGNVAFANKVDFPINTTSITELKMAIGDLNGDGKSDIVITNPGTNKLLIYRNSSSVGNISFVLATDADENADPTGVAIADFDVDGHPDIAVISKRTVSIYKNTGTMGAFVFAPKTDMVVNNDFDHISIAIGDFSLDGKPDIALGERAYSVVPIYENTSTIGNISFTQAANWLSYSYSKQIYVADFDQDNRPDIAYCSTNGFRIFRNGFVSNGGYGFDPGAPISTNNTIPTSIVAGNMNGDSLPDVIVALPNSNQLSVYGNVTSNLGYPFSVKADYMMPFISNSITVCDLDGDGKVDIAATGQGTATLAVIRNQQREPYIRTFTPSGGLSGTTITIKGLNFTGATAVQIGNVPAASFTVLSDTSITATVANGSTGSVSVTNGYGTGSLAGFVLGPPPTLTSFSPQAAAGGMAVTITGSVLTGTTAVSFGGIPARSFTNTSDTSVVAVVNTGASGYIKLIAATGTDSMNGFIFLPPPIITSLAPSSALTGTAITITGQNFTGTTAVSFGDIPAQSFTVVNDTTIQAVVGDGASGLIQVITGYGSATKSGFQYLGPSITSFTPISGGVGQLVTITGTKFTGATAVSFGNIPADSFTVISATTIRAYVGTKPLSGKVVVATPLGVASKTGFIAPPIITAFSPSMGPVGTVVTIRGNNFNTSPQNNIVFFGSIKATVLSANDSILTTTVPAYAPYAPISVTANMLTGFSTQSYTSTFTGGPLQPGSYSLSQNLPAGFVSNGNFSLNDMNLDGKPDIIGYSYSGDITISRNKSLPGTILFDSLFQMSSSLASTSLTTADVTNDGLPELITTDANFSNTLVSVYKNNTRIGGTFSLGSPKYYITNVHPTFVATGDIDGDGKTDMAVINNDGQTVSVFRNAQSLPTDTILFAARVDFAIGKAATYMVIKDLDSDGKPDIAIINRDSSTLSVLRNTSKSGMIAFTPRQVFTTGNSPRSMAVADLDGDGDMDIVTGNFSAYTVSVFTNTSTSGNISFAPKNDMATKNLPIYVSVNDLNGDFKPDIVVSQYVNYTTNNVGIGIFSNIGNSGTLAFDTVKTYLTTASPNIHVTTDIDGDGKTDIIYYGDRLSILRNKFNETPVITTFSPATASSGDTIFISGRNFSGAGSVSLGSSTSNSYTVLSDTLIQVIIYLGASGNVGVTTPYGTATQSGFTFINPPVITSFYPTIGPVGSTVAIKGMYFNSITDSNFVHFGAARATVLSATTDSLQVIVPAGATNEHLMVSTNGRTGYSNKSFSITFSGTALTPADYYFDTPEKFVMPGMSRGKILRLNDLDNDGKNDLIICGQDSINGGYPMIASKKNSSLPRRLSLGPRVDLPNGIVPYYFSLNDMNADGKQDVIISAYSDYGNIGTILNNSTTNNIGYQPALLLPALSFTDYSGVADMDGDGRPDIVATKFAASVQIFRNISVGNNYQYANPVVVAQISGLAGEGASLALEDFDGDGKTDIGVILYNSLTIFKNIGIKGTLSFIQVFTTTFSGSGVGRDLFATDLDGDGKSDIVFRDFYGSSFFIYRNTSTIGNISFAAKISIGVGSNTALGAVADADGDGKPELFACSTSGTYVGMYKNLCTPGIISFSSVASYDAGVRLDGMGVGDMDGDGRPELIISSAAGSVVSVLRNRISEPRPVTLCPSYATTYLFSNSSSNNGYRWQVNTGTGFTNIYDNQNYAFTDSPLLKLNNIPSSWTGYQYRCLAGGISSYIFELRFTNTWRGTVNNDWNNSANWTCGTLPDNNTDVIVESGTVVLNSSVTVKSLKVRTGASVRVINGAILTILQ